MSASISGGRQSSWASGFGDGHLDNPHAPDTLSEIVIGNAEFEFTPFGLNDPLVTASQVAQLVGANPLADYVVMFQTLIGELETLRPQESVDLRQRGIERFYVVRGDNLHRFFNGDLSYEWPRNKLSGENLRFLFRTPDDHDLLLARENEPDQVINEDDEVDLSQPGVERFHSRPSKGPITIIVDAEQWNPPSREMTPNAIIVQATNKNPGENYLVRIRRNGKQVSYKDKGEIPIRLKNGQEYLVVRCGPTPVSDISDKRGVEAFTTGLMALGYHPQQVPGKPDHLYFDYVVPTGKFVGKKVRIGLVVPPNFPEMGCPPGPHVSPPIHTPGQSGSHPTSNISDSTNDFGGAGGEWQYWSRPLQYWNQSKRNVATYMSHLWQLWDTQ